jgi:predicted  nucleic acid-binding Zn-ribbon protein
MNEKALINLKNRIDRFESEISEAKGQQKLLMKELKEKYGCDTLEEGEKRIEELNDQLDDLNHECEILENKALALLEELE